MRGQARNMQGLCCIEDLWVRVRRCNLSWSGQIKRECFTVRKCILNISYDCEASFIRLIHDLGFRCLRYEFTKFTVCGFPGVRHPHLFKKIGLPTPCMLSVGDLSPHVYKGQRSRTTNKIITDEIQRHTFTCSPQALISQRMLGSINNPLQNLEPKVGTVICQKEEKKSFQRHKHICSINNGLEPELCKLCKHSSQAHEYVLFSSFKGSVWSHIVLVKWGILFFQHLWAWTIEL